MPFRFSLMLLLAAVGFSAAAEPTPDEPVDPNTPLPVPARPTARSLPTFTDRFEATGGTLPGSQNENFLNFSPTIGSTLRIFS